MTAAFHTEFDIRIIKIKYNFEEHQIKTLTSESNQKFEHPNQISS